MRLNYFLAIAGASGTLLRFGVNEAVTHLVRHPFPWATLIANVAGCFLIGLLMTIFTRSNLLSSELKVVVVTGFLGAFTTFSAFSYDTFRLMKGGEMMAAFSNIAANLVLGFVAVALGAYSANLFKAGK